MEQEPFALPAAPTQVRAAPCPPSQRQTHTGRSPGVQTQLCGCRRVPRRSGPRPP